MSTARQYGFELTDEIIQDMLRSAFAFYASLMETEVIRSPYGLMYKLLRKRAAQVPYLGKHDEDGPVPSLYEEFDSWAKPGRTSNAT